MIHYFTSAYYEYKLFCVSVGAGSDVFKEVNMQKIRDKATVCRFYVMKDY